MGMITVLHSISDENRERILSDPPMILLFYSPEDQEFYLEEVKRKNRPGFLQGLFDKKNPKVKIEIPEIKLKEWENTAIDLDKAWHAIHYCLTKTDWGTGEPLSFLVDGGEEVSGVEIAYGPGRIFSGESVREIHEQLEDWTEERLKESYDPVRMDQLGIYPEYWTRDGETGFEYISHYFTDLKSFLADCVKHNFGMLVFLS